MDHQDCKAQGLVEVQDLVVWVEYQESGSAGSSGNIRI
jgi:hypothetical protein